jgi:hypothetical protein
MTTERCGHGRELGGHGLLAQLEAESWEREGMGEVICEFYSVCDCCDALMHKVACGDGYKVMKDGRTLCLECVKTEPESEIDQ